MTRIHPKRLYLVALPAGISGFRQPDVCGLVTGYAMRQHGLRDWCGPVPSGNMDCATFRIGTGRLPEFQPRVSFAVAQAYLTDFPSATVYVED